jgi:DNA-binding PadR family transcriptional regulator
MSTVDLMLLGALMEKPMNAYEMKKTMEFRNIRTWVKLSTPSIYKNLLSLKKKGYLDSKTVKESEMPEKTIYSINEKGRLYFIKLLHHFL